MLNVLIYYLMLLTLNITPARVCVVLINTQCTHTGRTHAHTHTTKTKSKA